MLTPTLRVIKFAWQDFFRNFWLSFVTLTILVLAIFSVNMLVIFNLIANSAIDSIQQKIDINIYFKPEINEDQVKNVRSYLESLITVREVQYVSREQALANFKEKHKDDPKILESLDELKDNPLGASLIIKAKSADDYSQILKTLDDPQYGSLIESKEVDDHRQVIERISNISQKVNAGVAIIVLIFMLISILIIYNAIKMAIYTHREEIGAMKLVGATNWFVMAPFLLQGVIFAILSLLISIMIVYPLLGVIQPYLAMLLENNFNIINYFNNNFIMIFGLQLIGAIVINLLSSFLAVSRYLKV